MGNISLAMVMDIILLANECVLEFILLSGNVSLIFIH